MVLLQVNVPRVALAPFEGDAPRAVHMKAVTLRFTPERMEIEARDVEIAQRRGLLERIQSPERPVLEVRRHFSASAFAKQFLKPLVAEASYHRASVTSPVTCVNRPATYARPLLACAGSRFPVTDPRTRPREEIDHLFWNWLW